MFYIKHITVLLQNELFTGRHFSRSLLLRGSYIIDLLHYDDYTVPIEIRNSVIHLGEAEVFLQYKNNETFLHIFTPFEIILLSFHNRIINMSLRHIVRQFQVQA